MTPGWKFNGKASYLSHLSAWVRVVRDALVLRLARLSSDRNGPKILSQWGPKYKEKKNPNKHLYSAKKIVNTKNRCF